MSQATRRKCLATLLVAAAATATAATGCSRENSAEDAYCAGAKKLVALVDKVDPRDRQGGLEVAKQFETLSGGAPDELRDDFDTIEEFFRTQRDPETYAQASKHITDYTMDSCDVDMLNEHGPMS